MIDFSSFTKALKLREKHSAVDTHGVADDFWLVTDATVFGFVHSHCTYCE